MMNYKHTIALELRYSLKKGPLTPYKACLIGKTKQLVINKYVDDSKKGTRAEKKLFSDLMTIKALQDSSTTGANKDWNFVVDQYTWYKESEIYGTKSDFVGSMRKKFSK